MVFISIVQPLVIVAGKNARTTLLLRRTSDSVTVAAGGWQGEVKGHIAQFEGDGQIRPTFGYIPIGFFQLWHADSEILNYPEGHTDAGREDSHFATLRPRHKRQLLPKVSPTTSSRNPRPWQSTGRGAQQNLFLLIRLLATHWRRPGAIYCSVIAHNLVHSSHRHYSQR